MFLPDAESSGRRLNGTGELNRMKGILLSLFLLAFPRLAASQAYTVTDLGSFYPAAINNAGQVAGAGVLWNKGKVASLGILVQTIYVAALNNRGQIVGSSGGGAVSAMTEHHLRAFLWQNGKLTDLGTPGIPSQHKATGINDSGQIIGSGIYKGKPHGFLLSPKS